VTVVGVLAAAMTDLDLTSLATGTRQHVFVRTGADDGWVYKIPATAGIGSHYGRDLANYRPIEPMKAALVRIIVRAPDSLHRRARARLTRFAGARGLTGALDRFHAAFSDARGRVMDVLYVRSRRQYFDTMLQLAPVITERSLGELMLPFHVLSRVDATLRVGDVARSYSGPMLVQQRADFFDRTGRFDVFDWDDVIRAQHRLWRCGLALSDANEVLGPKNWALVDGHLRLADLSSLTRSYRLASRVLRRGVLDERSGRVLSRLRNTNTAEYAMAERYFQHVRREVNQERLAQLWKRDGR
jgi:hypothetical protein